MKARYSFEEWFKSNHPEAYKEIQGRDYMKIMFSGIAPLANEYGDWVALEESKKSE